ncbi:MAG: hypothetical protein V7676_00105 [Parasphingorhabdus sp.]|jgi:hypothetical protein|uniref:hypothetical protein n=1 Tax=Parasphingorhabdus sp. TaxID=2709688 RepID=UPI0030012D5E
MSTKLRWTIAVLMSATIFRAQTVLFLPTVEMFGGIAPDAWFAPWFSDAILGFMVPVMVYLFWRRRGIAVWGVLVIYNAVGAFDYATGLATQWTDSMPAEMASATTVYLGISVFMVCELIALALLFHDDVIAHFSDGKG